MEREEGKNRVLNHPLNPWLAKAVRKLRANHSDEELKERFGDHTKTFPETTWADFLKDMALEAELWDNPILDKDIKDTGLPEHTVDILRINYIDKVGHIIQWSLEELFRMKGLSKYELNAILDLLAEGGLVIEAEGYTLKQESFRQIAERKPAKEAWEKAEEDIKAVNNDLSLSFAERAHRVSAIYEEAAGRLHSARADKEMLRKVFMRHADYLISEISCNPDLGEVAVRAAERNVRLTEYLYGDDCQDAIEARKLLGYTLMATSQYHEAIEEFQKVIRYLEAESGTIDENLALLYECVGVCLSNLKKDEEAIGFYSKSMSFYEKDEETYRRSIWRSCINIGDSYYEMGDYEKWKEFLKKSEKYKQD